MAGKSYSLKQLKIDKANSMIIGVTSAAVFIIIFSLLSSKALIGQRSYNNRLATAQQTALNQLKADVAAKNRLNSAYEAFISPAQNIIGGSSSGSGSNDGSNAQIILDALPSKYDFPALATSVQALLSRESVNVDSISGTDDQLGQQSSLSSTPTAVAIPIGFTIDGAYQNIENVINDVQNSIRPIQIQTLQMSGSETDIQVELSGQTYFLPEKDFNITSETVK